MKKIYILRFEQEVPGLLWCILPSFVCTFTNEESADIAYNELHTLICKLGKEINYEHATEHIIFEEFVINEKVSFSMIGDKFKISRE